MYQGNEVGTFQQTSVDLPQDAQAIFGSVYQTAAGPVNFFARATMGFLGFFGPGILEGSLALPETLGSIGIGTISGNQSQPAGAASQYVDITSPGSRYKNIQTDVSAQDFGNNLQAEGFTRSQRGDVAIYTKGTTEYTVYLTCPPKTGPVEM